MSSLVVEESSGSAENKRKASEISEISESEIEIPSPPPIIREKIDEEFEQDPKLDGWDEAQKQDGKPPLEPKNTDDRTMEVYRVFGEDISVLEVLEELGYKEGDKLPEGDMTTPVEDPNEDFKFDYYPTGLVTVVADTIKDMPDDIKDTLDKDSSKGEIMYQIVGYLNHYGNWKDKKIIPQEQIETIRNKYSEGRLKTGGKKRRRKTKRRKSRRKRKTKKRKRTRRKGRKRRKRKTRR